MKTWNSVFFYLDWVNNYLTVEKIASDYGLTKKKAKALIVEGKKLHEINTRLEYLRQELRAERISTGELLELQSLKEYIDPGDVELLEAAGVPEFN